MRPGRGFTGTGDPFQKGSSQSLPGSRGQGNHQHPPQRSQCGPHQPARCQKDRIYSQWPPTMGGSSTRVRHHLGIPFDLIQPAPKTCRPIRRSSAPGRTQIQGARIPRTSPFQTVQARGPRPRNRGPVEPGSNHFPPPLGPDKSQSSSQHPPQSCRSFPPLTLVGPACIAASLLDLDCAGTSILDGDTPSISQLLSEAPLPPRLPAVSQPAPKELRLGFGPALHAHPEPPV